MLAIKPEIFRVLFNKLWINRLLILLVTLTAAFASLAFTEHVTDELTFKATASVSLITTSHQGQSVSNNILTNYFDLATSRRVCEYAEALIKDTPVTATQIQRILSVSVTPNSYVMKINATHGDPQTAIQVANAVATSIVTLLPGQSDSYSLEVFDIAKTTTATTNNLRNRLRIATTVGTFILLCGYIVIKELRSDKIRLVSQCVEDEDEILAIIPYVPDRGINNGKNLFRGVFRGTSGGNIQTGQDQG